MAMKSSGHCLTIDTLANQATINKLLLLVTLLLLTSWLNVGQCVVECPVQQCYCTTMTHYDVNETLFLLNCSDGHLPPLPYSLLDSDLTYRLMRSNTYFPQFRGDPQQVTAIDLSGNSMETLKYDGFLQFTRLKYLDVSRNKIKEVAAVSFDGLTQLVFLNLSSNSLYLIEAAGFRKLPQLRTLDLTDNRLHRLRADVFTSVPHLRHLFLAGNELIDIEQRALLPLSGSLQALSLADNNLKASHLNTLIGLDRLQRLDVSANTITTVPNSTLARLTALRMLIMDRNPLTSIDSHAFQSTNLEVLSVSRMPVLQTVHSAAFVNMTQLQSVSLTFNLKLLYVSPSAFHAVNNLRALYLHHNQLQSLSFSIIHSLPRLQLLSIHSNPLLCDCNIRWLIARTQQWSSQRNDVNASSSQLIEGDIRTEPMTSSQPGPRILNTQSIACSNPSRLRNQLLSSVPLDSISTRCAPSILSSLDASYQQSLGNDLQLTCLAVGVPTPELQWLDPTDELIDGSRHDAPRRDGSRRRVLDNGQLLLLRQLQPRDSGTYACRASNELGTAQRQTNVEIYSSNIHLVLLAKTSSHIHLVWNCTESTVDTVQYVIIYRQSQPDMRYRRIPIHPHMRGYTFSELRAQTLYEFCVAYINTRQQPTPISCLKVRTNRHGGHVTEHKLSDLAFARIMISISVTSAVIALLCILSAACRGRRRKFYEEPNDYGGVSRTRKTKSSENLRITQIPLNDLYGTPTPSASSTSLYASTQSLIPGSKV